MFEDLFNKFNKFYVKIYSKYTMLVSKYYLAFICVPFILNLTLLIGILKVNFVKDSNDLFTFVESKSKVDEVSIRRLFDYKKISEDNNKYYIHQILDQGLFAEINFHVKNNSGKNILNEVYIEDIVKINQLIKEKIFIFSSELNANFTYKDLCAKNKQSCSIEGETLIFDKDFYKCKVINSDDELTDDNKLHIDAFTFKVTALSYNLGNNFRYTFNNNSKCVEAKLVKLRYALNEYRSEKYDNSIDYFNLSKQWELKFIEFMNELDRSEYSISFTYSVSQSLEIELTKTMLTDLYFVISSAFCMIILGFLILIFNSKKVSLYSILLPSCSIACAFCGLGSTVGLLSIFGYQMCEFVFLDLFILIGNFFLFKNKIEDFQKLNFKLNSFY